MKRTNTALLMAALAGACTAVSASGQVVLNEVYVNPPGSVDPRWEYVEVYGPAGMNLTGYMIAIVKGGSDLDGNGVPGPLSFGGSSLSSPDEIPEIDEAWSLDGLVIGGNGTLVIYNNTGASSFIPALCPTGPTGSALGTFSAAHVPTVDTAGNINNDGSTTVVLLRKRPFHAVNAQGVSVYDGVAGNTITSGAAYPSSIRYAWRKDVNHDVNFDGKVDLNGIGVLVVGGAPVPAEAPVNSEAPATPAVGAASSMEPYQMVDDVSWSNLAGREYTRSGQQKISQTPGFNPDAISRVAYYGGNPMRGNVFDAGVMSTTHAADEEWVYGDCVSLGGPLLNYDSARIGGPTDPSGPLYNAQGQVDPLGTYRLNDINLTGYKLTPGTLNDVDSTGSGGTAVTQARFVRGDFNFDGVVDCRDRELILDRLASGASLDDTEVKVRENGTVEITDDVQYTGWKWQGREFNGLLAMVRMSLTDGTTGEWNSGTVVTAADLAAFDAVFTGTCCVADLGVQGGAAGHDGLLDNNDFIVFIDYFFNQNPLADVGRQGGIAPGDGLFDNNDFVVFIDAFFAGCP